MKLAFLCFGCFIAAAAPPGGNIRTIDFANHEYPWRASDSWPHELEWLGASEPNRIRLVNGRWKMPDSDFEQPFAGLTLEEVVCGDLTGDSKDEAVLVVELYDPEKQEGDCCSSGLLRQQYRWDGQVFRKVGPMMRGSAKYWSRRRVSTFGLPIVR